MKSLDGHGSNKETHWQKNLVVGVFLHAYEKANTVIRIN